MAHFKSLKVVLGRIPLVGGRLLGFLRRARHTAELAGLPDKDSVVQVFGLQMTVRNPRKSYIGRTIYQTGVWEADVTEFISRRVRAGMTVIDVGADVGYYTLLFASRVGPQGRVIAFEPIPAARGYLDRNISANRLTSVTVCGFALADRAGTSVLEEPFKKSRVNLNKKERGPDDLEIELKVFDEWWESSGMGAIHLVKVDVEGAELMVLRGMERTLRAQHPALLVEIHPTQLPHFGHAAAGVVTFLTGLGYQPTPVDRPGLRFDEGNITVYWEHRPGP